MLLYIPVSVGEVFDKITILALKSKNITDPEALDYIRNEMDALQEVLKDKNIQTEEGSAFGSLLYKLLDVNSELWDVEDKLHNVFFSDHAMEPGAFFSLAKSVQELNLRRAQVKRDINLVAGSTIREVKQYGDSQTPNV